MPQFLIPLIQAIGYSSIVAGATSLGFAIMLNAAVISSGLLLLGGMALSSSQAKKAKRKAREQFNAAQVDRLNSVTSSISPRELVLGRVRKSGTVFFKASTGTDLSTFVMLVAIAGHEIDGVEQIYFNDEVVTVDGSGKVLSAPYARTVLRNSTVSSGATGVVVLPYTPVGSVDASTGTTWGPQGDGEMHGTSVTGSTVTTVANASVFYQYYEVVSVANVRVVMGTADQAADARLITLFPGVWTSAHRARGVAYLVCEFQYDEAAFPSGLPNVTATIRGAKVYDPRNETTAWSANPAILSRHIYQHLSFGKATITADEDARIIAAAHACDASQTYNVDVNPTTVARYRAATVQPFGSPARSALDDLAQAMAGSWAFAGGELYLKAGVFTSSVMDLTDADLAVVSHTGTSEQQYPISISTHKERGQQFNVVNVQIWDAEQDYKQVTLTPLKGAALITRDGVELVQAVTYNAIGFAPQALHVAGIMMRDARDPLTVVVPLKLRAYPVQLFDTVSLTLDRYGWATKLFQVVGRDWGAGGLLQLTLKETSAAIYNIDAAFSAQGFAQNTSLPAVGYVPPVGALTASSGTAELMKQSDGTVVSRIRVTWPALSSLPVTSSGSIELQFRDVLLDGVWTSVIIAGAETQAVLNGVQDGAAYFIRARARTTVAIGDWGLQVMHQVVGKTEPPPAFDTFSVKVQPDGTRQYSFTYSAAAPVDWLGAQIRYISGNYPAPNWAAMTPLHDPQTYYTSSPVEVNGPLAGEYTFAIKSVDTSGNASPYLVFIATLPARRVGNDEAWTPITGAVDLGAPLTSSPTAPTDPAPGDQWEDTSTALPYVIHVLESQYDPTPPPTPALPTVIAGLTSVFVEQATPTYTQGHGHGRTIVYGAVWTGGAYPVFADAAEIGTFDGNFGSFPSDPGTTWCVWIKWRSYDQYASALPAGGTNGVQVTTGQDVSGLLTVLTGEITGSQLDATLGTRVDLIDAAVGVTGSVAWSVAQEASIRASAISQEITDRGTAISNEEFTRQSGDDALATSISLLTAGVAGGFDVGSSWYFDSTVEGWTSTGGTQTWNAGYVDLVSTGTDPIFTSPVVSLSGATYSVVKARVKRLAGSGWDGTAFYSTAGHVIGSGYRKTLADPSMAIGDTLVLEWEMSDLTAGGTDWINNTITQIRLDLGATSSDQFSVDWVAVGRNAPGASQAGLLAEQTARINGDSAEVTARQTLSTKVLGTTDPNSVTLATISSGVLYEEKNARSSADSTEVTARQTLSTALVGATDPTGKTLANVTSGLVYDERTARSSADGTEVTARQSLSTKLTGLADPSAATLASITSGLLFDERTARSSADGTEVTARQLISATLLGANDPTGKTLANVTSGIIFDEKTARASETGSLASSVTTLQASVRSGSLSSMLPSTFDQGALYWTNSRDGDPATRGNVIGTLITNDPDFGVCFEISDFNVLGENVMTKGVIPTVAGRIYKTTARFKVMASDGAAAFNIIIPGQTITYGSASPLAFGASTTVTGIGAVTEVSATISDVVGPSAESAWGATAKYFRSGLRLNSIETGLVIRVQSIKIEDVTDVSTKASITYVDQAEADAVSASASSIAQLAAVVSNAQDVFTEKWESASALTNWISVNGPGETTIETVSDSATGAKILRVGNNSGNDQSWLVHTTLIPFDPSRLYRTTVKARRISGSGTVYFAMTGIASDKTTLVNALGGAAYSNAHNHTANGTGPAATWTTYVGYTKGFGATVGTTPAAPLETAPGQVHPNVRYLRPTILVNYNSLAGQVEVDSFIIEDVTDTAANSAAISTKASITYVDQAEADAVSASASSIAQLAASVIPAELDALRFYGFDTGNDGWFTNGTAVAANGIITVTHSIVNTYFSRTLAVAERYVGAAAPIIRARIRRVGATGAWEGRAYYSTAGHAANVGFVATIAAPTNPEQWTVVEWDMRALTAGGTDYVNSEILAIRLDFVSDSGSVWEIDWVAFGDVDTTPITAAIQTEATVRASQTGDLYAQYTVKLDVNSKVSGFGLASTGPTGAGSTFEIRSDKFVMAAPTGSAAGYVPFSVLAVPTLIGGVTLPAGVYANAAYIIDGQITNAKIGTAAIDDAKVANLSAAKLTVGDGTIGGNLKSSNYVASTSGWLLQPNGTAEFGAAAIRGQLSASQINTNGLTIRDTGGNIIFGSGASVAPSSFMSVPPTWLNTNQSWGEISGIPYDTIVSNDDAVAYGFNPAFAAWASAIPDGWVKSGATTTVTKETTIRRSGPNSVKMVVAAASTGYQYLSRTVSFATAPLPVGTFISGTVDVYVGAYTSGGSPGLKMRLYTNAGLTAFVDCNVKANTATLGTWQRIPFTARVGVGQQIYGINAYMMASNQEGAFGGTNFIGTVYFDGFTFALFDASLDNTTVQINENGTLSGAGSGAVSITGLGYTGSLVATANQSDETTNGAISTAGTTSTWGGVTGTGKPSDNATSGAVLLSSAGMSLVGNKATRLTGSGWDQQVYSRDGYTGGAYAIATPLQVTAAMMFGLNTDPTTSASYDTIDFSMYVKNNGQTQSYRNNTPGITHDTFEGSGIPGTYASGDVLSVTYDGSTVRWLKNGVVLESQVVAIAGPLYFDSSFNQVGFLERIQFGPYGNPSAVQPSNKITEFNASTYIAAAAIGNAQIGGFIQSDAYSAGSAGWKINKDGTAEFNTGTFRGDLIVGASPAISGTSMTGTGARLYANGTMVVGNSTKNLAWNGSALTVNGDVISTGNLNTNAVTIPLGAYTAGALNVNAPGTNGTVFVGIPNATSGKPVQLIASMLLKVAFTAPQTTTATVTHTLKLFRDAVELYSALVFSGSVTDGSYAASVPLCVSIMDTGVTSDPTYYMRVVTTVSGTCTSTATNSSLVAIQIKR
jgi:hypothetical protein